MTFGPIGFPAYARVRFIPDPIHEGQREHEADLDASPGETDQWRALLQLLASADAGKEAGIGVRGRASDIAGTGRKWGPVPCGRQLFAGALYSALVGSQCPPCVRAVPGSIEVDETEDKSGGSFCGLARRRPTRRIRNGGESDNAADPCGHRGVVLHRPRWEPRLDFSAGRCPGSRHSCTGSERGLFMDVCPRAWSRARAVVQGSPPSSPGGCP